MCFANAPLHQPVLALFELGLKQRFEEAKVRTPLAHGLFSELTALGGDGWQMQHLALLPDSGHFQHGGLRAHGTTSWLSSRSYSAITGNGRSNRASSPKSMSALRARVRLSAPTRCWIAAASEQPRAKAPSIADRSCSCP